MKLCTLVVLLVSTASLLWAQQDDGGGDDSIDGDERLTIQRPGYGVNFEKVADMADSILHYTHSWFVRMPNLTGEALPRVDCENDMPSNNPADETEWNSICKAINMIIAETESVSYAERGRGEKLLYDALNTIEKGSLQEIADYDFEAGDALAEEKRKNGERKKRDLMAATKSKSRRRRDTDDDEDPFANRGDRVRYNFTAYFDGQGMTIEEGEYIDDQLLGLHNWTSAPSELEKTWDKVNAIINPIGHAIEAGPMLGKVFSSLFNTPGSDDIKKLRQHLSNVAKGISVTADSYLEFSRDLSAVMIAWDERATAITDMGSLLVRKIKLTQESIIQHHKKLMQDISNLTTVIMMTRSIESTMMTSLLPTVFETLHLANAAYNVARMWADGITLLNRGFLSHELIPIQKIIDVIEHIRSTVLTDPRYADYRLVNSNPQFYYKSDRISYSRYDEGIMISVNFPLSRLGGTLRLYRVDVFPVPASAGMSADLVKDGFTDGGYTILDDMPDFIAVSDDLKYYQEMTTAQYLSCKLNGPVLSCRSEGMQTPKARSNSDYTCAFAVFRDIYEHVDKACSVSYTNTPPLGSAVQLISDGSFLIRSSPDDKRWTISCPNSKKNFYTSIEPCLFCRIEIPCSCSLTATHFMIPLRLSGCDEEAILNIDEGKKIRPVCGY